MTLMPISADAYEAVIKALPMGAPRDKPDRSVSGAYRVWLPDDTVVKLDAIRRSTENYSAVILRLVELVRKAFADAKGGAAAHS